MSEILTPEMQSRFERILGRSLGLGAHLSLEDGMCAMEAVSYVAGEPWSDAPQCACPVIAAFVRAWNDGLPSDADRDRLLKPLVPRLVGSRSTAAIEEQRARLVIDWVVRVWTPTWLELVPALAPHAERLRSLAAITDTAGLVAAGQHLNEAHTDASAARDAAWATMDASRDAAWATMDASRDAARAAMDATRPAALGAAWAATWYAAWDSAWAAALGAAWAAARDSAWDAARAAARDSAWYAARDAARDAAAKFLQPTVERLQLSALDLIDRMLALRADIHHGGPQR